MYNNDTSPCFESPGSLRLFFLAYVLKYLELLYFYLSKLLIQTTLWKKDFSVIAIFI